MYFLKKLPPSPIPPNLFEDYLMLKKKNPVSSETLVKINK